MNVSVDAFVLMFGSETTTVAAVGEGSTVLGVNYVFSKRGEVSVNALSAANTTSTQISVRPTRYLIYVLVV